MNNNYYNPYYTPQPTIPMVYVNGLEGAKSYWMGTNQIAYLRDNNDESILYEKKTDAVGRYQIRGYRLVELQAEQNTNDLKALCEKIDTIYTMLSNVCSSVSSEASASDSRST